MYDCIIRARKGKNIFGYLNCDGVLSKEFDNSVLVFYCVEKAFDFFSVFKRTGTYNNLMAKYGKPQLEVLFRDNLKVCAQLK